VLVVEHDDRCPVGLTGASLPVLIVAGQAHVELLGPTRSLRGLIVYCTTCTV
jgi:hypothetical protein